MHFWGPPALICQLSPWKIGTFSCEGDKKKLGKLLKKNTFPNATTNESVTSETTKRLGWARDGLLASASGGQRVRSFVHNAWNPGGDGVEWHFWCNYCIGMGIVNLFWCYYILVYRNRNVANAYQQQKTQWKKQNKTDLSYWACLFCWQITGERLPS